MKIQYKNIAAYPLIERLVFTLLAVLFLSDIMFGFVPEPWYPRFFLLLLFYYVTQQLLLETYLHHLDGAFHQKYRASFYVPNSSWKVTPIKRRGLWGVILIYIIFVGVTLAMKWKGVITWPLYLFGANVILLLNNIFIYYKCPFQALILKDVTCCADCHINAWDYIIFSTGLLMVPSHSPVLLGICWFLWGISLLVLIIWETSLRRHPERFTPLGNRSLGCKNCMKRCTSSHSLLNRRMQTKHGRTNK